MSRSFSLVVFSLLLALLVCAAPPTDQTPLAPSKPHASHSWSWEDCGTPNDVVQIDTLVLTPDPPLPGKNLTVHATGYVASPIRLGATADVTVKLGLIKLIQKSFDICSEADKANVSLKCPVSQGQQEVSHTVALPLQIPPAKFGVQVQAFNYDKAPLLCVDIKIDFLPSLAGFSL